MSEEGSPAHYTGTALSTDVLWQFYSTSSLWPTPAPAWSGVVPHPQRVKWAQAMADAYCDAYPSVLKQQHKVAFVRFLLTQHVGRVYEKLAPVP